MKRVGDDEKAYKASKQAGNKAKKNGRACIGTLPFRSFANAVYRGDRKTDRADVGEKLRPHDNGSESSAARRLQRAG